MSTPRPNPPLIDLTEEDEIRIYTSLTGHLPTLQEQIAWHNILLRCSYVFHLLWLVFVVLFYAKTQ